MSNTSSTTSIDIDQLANPMDYLSYLQLTERLVAEKKTTGQDQSLKMIEYTSLNLRRMKRLGKTIKLSEELEGYLKESHPKLNFLVLSEAWCGDAAQNLPLLAKVAEEADWIDLKIVLRDENPKLMDQFLTNGGRSIPKLIVLDQKQSVLGSWGPRPEPAQDMVMKFKQIPNGDYEEFVKQVQLWYAKDKTLSQQTELLAELKKWCS